jgi:hypothetical protein
VKRIVGLGSALVFAACGGNTEAPPGAPTTPVVAISPVSPRTDVDLKAQLVTPSTDSKGAAVSYRYSWLKNNEPQADLTTDTVPAARTTKADQWTVIVIASANGLDAVPAQALTKIENTPPSVTVTMREAAPTSATGLEAVVVTDDADGDKVSLTFAWTKDGQATPFVEAKVPAGQARRGEAWKVTVTPKDPEEGEAVEASATIANSLPVLAEVALAPAAPTKAGPVEARPVASDGDLDTLTFAYAWTVDGRAVAGQAGQQLATEHFSKGQRVAVSVTVTDGVATSAPKVAAGTVEDAAPSIASVAISPASGSKADTFTCAPAGWSDADGDAPAYEYRWEADGVPVGAGATLAGPASSIVKGQTLTCTVTPVSGLAKGAAVASPGLVLGNAPPTLAAVTLSPASPRRGDELVVQATGVADVDPGDPILLRYEWTADGAPLAVTGDRVPAGTLTKGQQVSVRVFASNGAGSAEVGPAGASATVANSPPSVGSVAIGVFGPVEPTPMRGKALAATSSDVLDADPADTVTLAHQWRINGTDAGTDSYLLDGMLLRRGDRVTAAVTPLDGDGARGLTVTSPELVVQNAPPSAPVLAVSPAAAPREDDNLVCSVGTPSLDADGDTVTYSFEWTKAGQPFPGAANATDRSTVPESATQLADEFACAVVARDGQGGEARASHAFAPLLASCDTAAPRIASVAASAGDLDARVTWLTDEGSTSRVELVCGQASCPVFQGPSSTCAVDACSLPADESAFACSHAVDLTGLVPATAYQYVVVSVDKGGRETRSAVQSFTTLASVLVINELFAAPKLDTTAAPTGFTDANQAKFVELLNVGPRDVDLTPQVVNGVRRSYALVRCTDPSCTAFTESTRWAMKPASGASGVLVPGAYAVAHGNAFDATKAGVPGGALRLVHDGTSTTILMNGLTSSTGHSYALVRPDGSVMSTYNNQLGTPTLSANTGRSFERATPSTNCWYPSAAAISGAAGNFATPGAPNSAGTKACVSAIPVP